MYYYRLYNHTVASEIALDNINVLNKIEQADVSIKKGEVPNYILREIKAGMFEGIEENEMWFYLKDQYVFEVKRGKSIFVYEMSATPNKNILTTYLTGLVFAIILVQRGFITLHGSVLKKEDKVFVISGLSGSGKTTTTLGLMKNGYLFMNDDIAPIDSSTMNVMPSTPAQKLCPDLIRRENIPSERIVYLGEEQNKYIYFIEQQKYCSQPEPISIMIELQVSDDDKLYCEEVKGADKLNIILRNTYCLFFMEKILKSKEIMKKYLQIANNIQVHRIKRPKEVNTQEQIVEYIESI